MALIKCSECNKEISDRAEFCPNCGCPLNNNTNTIVSEETDTVKANNESANPLCLSGMIVGFISFLIDPYALISIIGLVLSILGLNQVNHIEGKSKTYAIIGIICSAIEFVLKFIQIISYM